MKKITTLFILFVFFTAASSAQQKMILNKSAEKIDMDVKPDKQRAKKLQITNSETCGNDTIYYVHFKMNDLLTLPLVGNRGQSYGEGLGQWFDAPQPVTVHGFTFYGRTRHQTSTPVNVSVYSAKADSTPNVLLGGTSITLNFTSLSLTALRRNVNFPTPITVTGPYLVVVEAAATSTDTIELVITDDGDGYDERLPKLRVLGDEWIDVDDAYSGLDVDFYTFPIVSYTIAPKFSVSGTQAANETINFTNTSSPVFFNRFYNFYALLDELDSSFLWNFGDSPGQGYAVDTSHVYTAPGSYDVKLSSLLYGYSIDCLADTTGTIIISFGLPVKLTTWEASRKENKVNLTWSTADEQNNKGFELQRSADGVNFSTFTFVPSKASDGNSSSTLSYRFTDVSPFEGNTYYRLNQVDKDGKSSLSDIVLVKGLETNTLVLSKVYPSPAQSQLKVVLNAPSNDEVKIIITDLSGRMVMQQNSRLVKGNNNVSLNVSGISTGSYFIKAICSNGCETVSKKFIKQ